MKLMAPVSVVETICRLVVEVEVQEVRSTAWEDQSLPRSCSGHALQLTDPVWTGIYFEKLFSFSHLINDALPQNTKNILMPKQFEL